MSTYTIAYDVRYNTPSLHKQAEVATVKCVEDIKNEGASAPDHDNRAKWATWANKNSPFAVQPFLWPIANNPSIQASIAADPTGGTVSDNDVQFVVNSNLEFVIADFIANPPSQSIQPLP